MLVWFITEQEMGLGQSVEPRLPSSLCPLQKKACLTLKHCNRSASPLL